ncbi:MAG TPA: hypothetical protein VFB39_05530 [Solirubrobacteraceae bacterium]|nr:hypothetical protein [Solirubrobacteraceae bacterium]
MRRWFPTIVGLVIAIVVLVSRGGDKHVTAQPTAAGRQTAARVVHYQRWAYVNPLRAVQNLRRGRVDMGVDYDGSGPILALGRGKVTMASDHDSGPEKCWGRTCWPVGGIVVYRLMDGPFAGKYVYDAENITVNVIAGQTVRAGEQIATLRPASPYLETGWASGNGSQTLAIAKHQQYPSSDPGAWSTIEGRNFNHVLIRLGAPSGILQPKPPNQSMPAGWPRMATKSGTARAPQSSGPISEGSTGPR